MCKDKSRALKFFHIERIKNNRKNYSTVFCFNREGYSKRLGKSVKTPTPCSCWMCGNPRKYYKARTLAEISFDEISNTEY